MNSTQYLFCYGTLLRDTAPPSMAALCRRLPRLAVASVSGTLYDLGSYPGFVLDSDGGNPVRGNPEGGDGDGEGVVRGEIVVVQCASDWLRLDAYESFDRGRPERSLFKRVRTTANTAAGDKVECWVYVYNRALRQALRIDSGCWRTYLSDGEEYVAVPC